MSADDKPATGLDSLIPGRSIGAAFPWIVEGLREIRGLVIADLPGLARVKAEEMIAKLEGRT